MPPPETKEKLPLTIPGEFQPIPEAFRALPEVTGAINVAELPGDEECIAEAQANLRARKAGDVALGETIQIKKKPIRNIKEGLDWAETGDEGGIAMLDGSIIKEMSEYLYKAGNVSSAELGVDSQARFLQNGQLMQDVYRNGYQLASAHPILRARTSAEGNNGARLEHLNKQGLLDTHTFVVFSRTPDHLSDEQLDELKFFSATKSLSIQATSKGPDGLKTETAFVAGVPENGQERTDKKSVEAIYEYFGVDCRGKTAEELLDMPLLIPNEYMVNGVIDIVKLYDDINGGTFYGQNKSRQDYKEHKRFCEEREKRLDADRQSIRRQLISENNKLDNAVEVSKRLAKLVEKRLVKIAIKDDSVDERVFGSTSAGNILAARMHTKDGNWELAMVHAQTAVRTAAGGSCPTSLESILKIINGETADEDNQNSSDNETLECVNCPSCGTFHDEVKKDKDGKYHCKNKDCRLH